jgi:hypothetical protein
MEMWDWFVQEQLKYRGSTGSSPHQRMFEHYFKGNRLMRSQQTAHAYTEYTAGYRTALQLKEPCWELFFQYWQLETRTYYEWNIKDALDVGVRASTQAHKPAYQDCPVRPLIFLTLAEVYSFMDAVGYKAEIDKLVDYILTETPPAEDGELRIQYMQACVAFEHDDLREAENIIAHYRSRLVLNPFRETFYHTLMRRISFAQGDIPRAFNFAQDGAKCARLGTLANPEGWNRLWSAALAQRMGNEYLATQLYDAGLAHFQTHALAKSVEFYDAACDYHKQRGETERALQLRGEQMTSQEKIGSIQYLCHRILQQARLLGRLGHNIQPAIRKARELAAQLQKPALYLAKVQRVEAGHYHEYDWQR